MDLNIITPINYLGYGIAGQNIVYSLHTEGVKIALFPIGPIEAPDDKRQLIEELKANGSGYNLSSPCLRIWHQDNLAEFVGKGMHIGFPFFELNRFNAREKHHLNVLDRIFVASGWAKGIVEEQIGRGQDTHIVPLGVDRDIFHEDIQTTEIEADYTTFVNVGKWERRKGHDFLLGAFCKAFEPTDKVLLKMVCFNPFIGTYNDVWAKRYLGSKMARNIRLVPRLTTQQTLARFLMGSDCGVFPARAEGWNLELLEMMSMGKHVITTCTTAHTEFANTENAHLITVQELETAEDGIFFHGFGEWAQLGPSQEEQLIQHLREVHRLKQTGQLQRNIAGIETAKTFSWQNTISTIFKGLQ